MNNYVERLDTNKAANEKRFTHKLITIATDERNFG